MKLRRPGRIVVTLALIGTCVPISGCLKLRAGQPVNVEPLSVLVVGESSESDVRQAIGRPIGRGRSFLPLQEEPVEMWTYYYERGTLTENRRTFLFVYLEDGVYQGHLWFSSRPEAIP